jgi:hypothetical protein
VGSSPYGFTFKNEHYKLQEFVSQAEIVKKHISSLSSKNKTQDKGPKMPFTA